MRFIKHIAASVAVFVLCAAFVCTNILGADISDNTINPSEDNNSQVSLNSAGQVSVAKNKPCSASSQSLPPGNAVDGIGNTRWASDWQGGGEGASYAWLTVDLCGYYKINGGKIKWEAAYAAEYKIQVSDDNENFTDICTVTDGKSGFTDLDMEGTGRYVRVECIKKATSWGFSIYEFEVYGEPIGIDAPLSPYVSANGSVAEDGTAVRADVEFESTYSDTIDGILALIGYNRYGGVSGAAYTDVQITAGSGVVSVTLEDNEAICCKAYLLYMNDDGFLQPLTGEIAGLGEYADVETVSEQNEATPWFTFGFKGFAVNADVDYGAYDVEYPDMSSRLSMCVVTDENETAGIRPEELKACKAFTVFSTNDGKNSIKLNIDAQLGRYTMKLIPEGFSDAYAKMMNYTFDYNNRERINKLIKDLIDAAEAGATDDFDAQLRSDEFSNQIGLDIDYYLAIEKAENRGVVASAVKSYKESIEGEPDYDKIKEDIAVLLKKYSLLAMTNEIGTGNLRGMIEQYNEDFERYIGLTDIDVYKKYYLTWNVEKRNVLLKRAEQSRAETIDEFRANLVKSILLGVIEGAESYSDVREVFSSNTEFFGAYESVSPYDVEVYSKMKGQSYDSAGDVNSAKASYYSAAQNNSRGSTGAGGGSSSGRGGSSPGRMVTPSLYQTQVNVPAEVENLYPPKFEDLEGYEWAESEINALAEKEIINGADTTHFLPGGNVKREEFIKMLVCAFDIYDRTLTSAFSDVPDKHWSEAYIASAEKYNLVNGVGDGSFGLGQEITRQDLMTMCYSFLKSADALPEPSDSGQEYGDAADESEISDYAAEPIKTLRAMGIVSGREDGTVAPRDFATRAEAAKIIYGVYCCINSQD